ncbi:alpha/beta hydrolase [Bosea sp. 685]|uniref:alpha/beta hydrolase n=1 Tax=Bosea sp. 685 TaxID=3080057 RepID=UPI0028937DA5|nr:alpha/beta hydrolase [Bosea sp. 685]WNJ91838.1 alpha/beta hydrolase [Bosea sp. 685]
MKHTTTCQSETAGDVTYLSGRDGEPTLLLRRVAGTGPSVVYVHGATFPSALSVAYRFGGLSWMDDLAARGFDVWAFDFAGFGGSDRPPAFEHAASESPPFGRACDAEVQLARVLAHVRQVTGRARLSLIAHSWGTIVAGLHASLQPGTIERLVFFGPIAQRDGPPMATGDGPESWRLVSIAQQLARFVEDVPAGHPAVLIEPGLASWAPAYLASDPGAAARRPVPAVRIPAGPAADIKAAWAGNLAYEPARVQAPTLIVRGAWDGLCTDDDALWLRGRLGAAETRDVKIVEGTHLMHLEHARLGLFEATGAFLMKTWF